MSSISVRITSPELEELSAPGLRDQVNALGRPAGEDDFIRACCIYVLSDARPRFL